MKSEHDKNFFVLEIIKRDIYLKNYKNALGNLESALKGARQKVKEAGVA
jgi:hypothetical protein